MSVSIWHSTVRWKYLPSSVQIWMMRPKHSLHMAGCLMELLKQPLCNPLTLHEQVITLWTATHKKMVHVDKKDVKKYQMDMLAYFDNVYPEIGKEIDETKLLSDELGEKILQVADEFKDRAAAK